MNFKAVFFDFDYTLADGTEAIVAGFRYAFGRMGLPEPTEEAIRPTIGMVLEDEFTFLSGEADPARRAEFRQDRKSTRLNSSHSRASRMPSSA